MSAVHHFKLGKRRGTKKMKYRFQLAATLCISFNWTCAREDNSIGIWNMIVLQDARPNQSNMGLTEAYFCQRRTQVQIFTD